MQTFLFCTNKLTCFYISSRHLGKLKILYFKGITYFGEEIFLTNVAEDQVIKL